MVKKIKTRCKDGTIIWRYQTAQERLLDELYKKEKKGGSKKIVKEIIQNYEQRKSK